MGQKYLDELKKAMNWLGEKDDTIFIGQTVECPGSAMFKSLEEVDDKKKIEMPVFEDTQMGISIGLALEGFIPISVFPRIDFLICAINQLVNHLDKIEEMSHGEFTPGIIIRTQIGASEPLNPGLQHMGDYRDMLSLGLKKINIYTAVEGISVEPLYVIAYERAKMGISSIIVELPQSMDKETWEKNQNANNT